ncbi:MAG: CPBP family intramembrane metalloprotease [Chloroflexi bacterium]|nr:type II CAAX endopeptidase family protein [Anaerolineaceae bacterium]NMB89420.1 CPBP family intramembrane metalloprotease [Chloroflexota bacterium]
MLKHLLAQIRRRPPERWSWRASAFLLATALAVLALLWWSLHSLLTDPSLAVSLRLALLAGVALLFLFIALGGLSLLFGWQSERGGGLPGWLAALLLAYLFPVLLLALPGWLRMDRSGLPAFLQVTALAPGQNWVLYLWQALVLSAYGLGRLRSLPGPERLSGSFWPVVAGLLTGLATWLAAAFTYGLLAPLEAVPAPVQALPTFSWGVAWLAAPWAEEYFYRSVLVRSWQGRLGALPAVWASAALFATLQLRPLMWLPAFVCALAWGELRQRSGRLLPAILAHTLFNVLVLLSGWDWVV